MDGGSGYRIKPPDSGKNVRERQFQLPVGYLLGFIDSGKMVT
jgi:hypothetical protein